MSTGRRAHEDSELFSISQVNALTGVSAPTLRKWESAFREYLNVVRTRGGQRRFSEDAIRKIETLKRLIYEEGLSLQGARRRIEQMEIDAGGKDNDSEANIEKLSELVTDLLIQKLFRHGLNAPTVEQRFDAHINRQKEGHA